MPKKKKCGTCAHCLQPKLKMKCLAMAERPPLQDALSAQSPLTERGRDSPERLMKIQSPLPKWRQDRRKTDRIDRNWRLKRDEEQSTNKAEKQRIREAATAGYLAYRQSKTTPDHARIPPTALHALAMLSSVQDVNVDSVVLPQSVGKMNTVLSGKSITTEKSKTISKMSKAICKMSTQ